MVAPRVAPVSWFQAAGRSRVRYFTTENIKGETERQAGEGAGVGGGVGEREGAAVGIGVGTGVGGRVKCVEQELELARDHWPFSQSAQLVISSGLALLRLVVAPK